MSDVVEFPGRTLLRTPVSRVLSSASKANLTDVAVIGRTQEGNLFLASSSPDGPEVVWLIELAKLAILEAAE